MGRRTTQQEEPQPTDIFDGDQLDVVPGAGQLYVVIRRVCDALGIRAQRQTAKLRSDEATAQGVHMKLTPSPGGP